MFDSTGTGILRFRDVEIKRTIITCSIGCAIICGRKSLIVLEIKIGDFVFLFLRKGFQGNRQGLVFAGGYFKGIGIQVAFLVQSKIQSDVRTAFWSWRYILDDKATYIGVLLHRFFRFTVDIDLDACLIVLDRGYHEPFFDGLSVFEY